MNSEILAAAADVLGKASSIALCEAVLRLADQLGVREFDGKPVDQWLVGRRLHHVESQMKIVQERDPGFAKQVQAAIDKVVSA